MTPPAARCPPGSPRAAHAHVRPLPARRNGAARRVLAEGDAAGRELRCDTKAGPRGLARRRRRVRSRGLGGDRAAGLRGRLERDRTSEAHARHLGPRAALRLPAADRVSAGEQRFTLPASMDRPGARLPAGRSRHAPRAVPVKVKVRKRAEVDAAVAYPGRSSRLAADGTAWSRCERHADDYVDWYVLRGLTGPARTRIGDVGSTEEFHVGDEAMLEALVGAAGRSRLGRVSFDPAATVERDSDPSRLSPRLHRRAITGAARGPAGGGPGVRRRRRSARGGSRRGDRGGARRRARLRRGRREPLRDLAGARLRAGRADDARAPRGLPVVVSGQTLGPALEGRQCALLAGAAATPRSSACASGLAAARARPRRPRPEAPRPAARRRDPPRRRRAPRAWTTGEPFIAVTLCTLGAPDVEAGCSTACRSSSARSPADRGEAVLVPHVGALDGSSSPTFGSPRTWSAVCAPSRSPSR